MNVLAKFRSKSWKERFLAFWLSLSLFFPVVYIVALLVDERSIGELKITLFGHVYIGVAAVGAGLLITPGCAALLAVVFAIVEPFGKLRIRNEN